MTNMDSKITFVIVPGAWHPASLYDEFTSRLRDAGYGAVVATYPSCGSPNPQTATCEQDTDVLRQQCISLIEDGGKELLLVCHSYGGIPGGGAAFGLSKKDRLQEGKEGGVIGLVYMSAFVVPEGISLFDFLGRQHAPYVIRDTVSSGFPYIPPSRNFWDQKQLTKSPFASPLKACSSSHRPSRHCSTMSTETPPLVLSPCFSPMPTSRSSLLLPNKRGRSRHTKGNGHS